MPKNVAVTAGPPPHMQYSAVLYGSCTPGPEGCADPLEIQSWPECGRNLLDYGQRFERLRPSHTDSAFGTYRIPGAERIPAVNNGGILEIFTGDTDVVIYAGPDLRRQAVKALAPALVRHARLLTRHELVQRADGRRHSCVFSQQPKR